MQEVARKAYGPGRQKLNSAQIERVEEFARKHDATNSPINQMNLDFNSTRFLGIEAEAILSFIKEWRIQS